jgi:hypothetical protein
MSNVNPSVVLPAIQKRTSQVGGGDEMGMGAKRWIAGNETPVVKSTWFCSLEWGDCHYCATKAHVSQFSEHSHCTGLQWVP